MNFDLISYIIYLPVSIYVTVWVGKKLHKNGRWYLLDMFGEESGLVDTVNNLLLVGYYLLNLGYCGVLILYGDNIESFHQLIEVLTIRIGLILIILGGMNYFNLFWINLYRIKILKK